MRYVAIAALAAFLLLVGFAFANEPTSSLPLQPKTTVEKPKYNANCKNLYTRKQFRKVARKVYVNSPSPVTKGERKTIKRIVNCQHSAKSERLVRKTLAKYKKVRAQKYYWVFKFNRLSSYDRGWAYSTGACESGNNPRTATGNGFYGAFQFMLSTAWNAGFKKSPNLTSWHEQAVRAVWWRNKTSDEQWPVCGD